jgi:FtsZ-interacting cell division protein ZipA
MIQENMRFILLAIGALIILAIFWDGTRRKKRQKKQRKKMMAVTPDASADEAVVLDQAALIVDEPVDDEPVFESAALAIEETDIAPQEPVLERQRATPLPKTIFFTLTASEEKSFGGFNLLQVLLSNGFRSDSDGLFYYHADRDSRKERLFGLAAATQAGTFDLRNMARFNCKGLVLFLQTDSPALLPAFNTMVGIAKRLAEDLNGTLFIEQDHSWDDESIEALRLTVSV